MIQQPDIHTQHQRHATHQTQSAPASLNIAPVPALMQLEIALALHNKAFRDRLHKLIKDKGDYALSENVLGATMVISDDPHILATVTNMYVVKILVVKTEEEKTHHTEARGLLICTTDEVINHFASLILPE